MVEEFSRVPADDGVHEIVLVLEIQIERSLGDPRLFHDLADRCFFHTVGSEQAGRTLFDRVARSGLVPSADAPGFAVHVFSHACFNTFPVDISISFSTLCSPNEDDMAGMSAAAHIEPVRIPESAHPLPAEKMQRENRFLPVLAARDRSASGITWRNANPSSQFLRAAGKCTRAPGCPDLYGLPPDQDLASASGIAGVGIHNSTIQTSLHNH